MAPDITNPFVTVLIPTYGRPEETAVAVQSVVDSEYPHDRFEVIVIDTSPDDRTEAAIRPLERAYPDRVRFLKKYRAEGPGASRNFGALQARGEIFACFDSDCVATPQWLAAGVGHFAGDPLLGIVQGRTLPNPQHPRGMMARFVRVDGPNCIYECCNVFYRRAAFEEVDGFSPDFHLLVHSGPGARKPNLAGRLLRLWSFAHFNALLGFDTDLAWRVLGKGWRSKYEGEALVYHAVTRLTPTQWMMEGAYYAYANPPMIRRHPGIRRHLYARYFASKTSALFVLFVVSLIAAVGWHWLALAGCLPYIANRCSEPSRFWKGPIRPFRFLVYIPRDFMAFLFSVLSSCRHRVALL